MAIRGLCTSDTPDDYRALATAVCTAWALATEAADDLRHLPCVMALAYACSNKHKRLCCPAMSMERFGQARQS